VAATSDALLEHVTAAPEEAAIFLDFDGVLAPIVPRPEDAYPPPEARAELVRLADRYPLVAVVSGRAGEDVRERVAVDGLVYVGSHGLELDRQADRWRQQIVDFAGTAPWPPSETELKGLSVAFHYRRASARGRTRRALRPQGARSATARRLEQGNGSAPSARGRRADPRTRGRR
jgi:trehalose-phosphatase